MTLLHEHVRATVSTAEAAPVTARPYRPEHAADDHQPELTPEQKFAKNAVLRFFDWLAESPNNPNYTSSPTYLRAYNWLSAHRSALEKDIVERKCNVAYDHLDYDSTVLQRLHQGAQRQQWNERSGQSVPEPMMFAASEIANAGIEEILKNSQRHQVFEIQEESLEQVDEDIVKSIGAQIVRFSYLEYISNERPRALSKEGLAGFGSVYKQNIISDIHRAALINNRVAQMAQATEDATNIVPIKKAA